MAQVFNLSSSAIYDHCFSADRRVVAITKENNAEVFDVSSGKPKLVTILEHHDKPITAIDISIDGKIVTCSQDRNALVWTPLPSGGYKPTLVLLRINRAATCVRWSPNGQKFAVGSSARVISVCYFEEENDWWISKHIKKPLRSTVLCVDWHPNGVLLACGSTDGHTRVFSAYIKSVDEKPAPSVWGERLPFQTLCLDFVNSSGGGWIHGVKFSDSADFLAFVSHDSTVNVLYPQGQEPKYMRIKTSNEPFKSLVFAGDAKIICAGHDAHPVVFEGDFNSWKETYSIDDPKTAKKHEATEQSALNLFRQMDLKGKSDNGNSKLATIHQNTITSVRNYSTGVISTCGLDGKVVLFPL